MRLGIVATLLLTSLLSTAAAQVPEPADLVLLACDTVDGAAPQAHDLLPLCPRTDEPQAPPADDAAAAPPAPPEAPAPQAAEDLASAVAGEAQSIPEDPASAPERAGAIIALIVQFVQDLLDLPVEAAVAVGDAIATGTRAVGDAVATAGATVADATQDAAASVAGAAKLAAANLVALFTADAHDAAPLPDARGKLPSKAPALDVSLDLRAVLARA